MISLYRHVGSCSNSETLVTHIVLFPQRNMDRSPHTQATVTKHCPARGAPSSAHTSGCYRKFLRLLPITCAACLSLGGATPGRADFVRRFGHCYDFAAGLECLEVHLLWHVPWFASRDGRACAHIRLALWFPSNKSCQMSPPRETMKSHSPS